MSRDQREEFYKGRIERLSGSMPGFRPEVTWTVLTLATLHDALAKQLNARLAEYDLTMASFNVLAVLQERGQIPLNAIGTLLIKTAANVTGLVDGLAKRGLVRRVPHPEDRRVKLAELSPEGQALIDRVLPEHHAMICQLFVALEPQELVQLTGLMRRVMDSLPQDGSQAQ